VGGPPLSIFSIPGSPSPPGSHSENIAPQAKRSPGRARTNRSRPEKPAPPPPVCSAAIVSLVLFPWGGEKSPFLTQPKNPPRGGEEGEEKERGIFVPTRKLGTAHVFPADSPRVRAPPRFFASGPFCGLPKKVSERNRLKSKTPLLHRPISQQLVECRPQLAWVVRNYPRCVNRLPWFPIK